MIAKLFEKEDGNQVLVIIGSNKKNDNPEVQIIHEFENNSTMSMAFQFEDSDEGFEAALNMLKSITFEEAMSMLTPTVSYKALKEKYVPEVMEDEDD